MRTEKTWNEKILPTYLKQFSPRIQQDLQKYSYLTNLPKVVKSTYIYGKVNTGKTLLAVKMMLAEIKQLYLNKQDSQRIELVSLPAFIEELKLNFDDKQSMKDHHNLMFDAHLLVLDDLGIDKPSDWIISVLYLIINQRWEFMKNTIITSNFSLSEIAKRWEDDRITSRIKRMCRIVNLTKTY